ncbi:MAG: 2-phospho-L-lactate transferase [Anaerolineae bacterium]|nr:2-phospho-L-lactate transferase [Anaerolineae bacterium]
MDTAKVVVLVGGVGGAKLAHGLAQILPPENLTVIVNTGDDFWHYGLKICPDLDTVMYTLSGLVDKTNGWGVGGDTTRLLEALGRLGETPWFRLGDQDLATHLLRTNWIQAGERLTTITGKLNKALGVNCTVLPMTDATVSTMLDTVEMGELEFQPYFVRYRWQPTVKAIRYVGIESATVSAEACEAILAADVILIGPSNPWLSIAPILAVPGMRNLLESRNVPRAAVSPIVGGKAIKGPAAKLMAELGYTVSAETVAQVYGTAITGFVYDEADADLRIAGLDAVTFNTVMQSDADRASLARHILEWTLRKT